MSVNVYFDNYMKYYKLSQQFEGEYSDLMKEVSARLVPRRGDEANGQAVVLFGFSGNGKSTWIRNFCEEHSDYSVLSMDTVVNRLRQVLRREPDPGDIIMTFGHWLDQICARGSNVVVDGNFLNLLTRSALTDSLHMYGYDVTLADITPIFEEAINHRIMDKAGEDMGVVITEDNLQLYENDPKFIARKNHVMAYHAQERENSAYDEQVLLGATNLGVEKIIVPYKEPGQKGETKH